MKLVRIFGHAKLYAIQYPEEELDEYHRLLEHWNDAEYLLEFFETHEKDLSFYKTSPGNAAKATLALASALEENINNASLSDIVSGSLQILFKPLYNNETSVDVEHQRTKARERWLRMYAVRIDINCFVISGGAIKLTRTMKEREHTDKELRKIDRTISFLKENGLFDENDFEILEL